jgi:Tol biopolymer transport system component
VPPFYQGQLAFNSNRDGHYEIWLVNTDGSGLRQLTDGGLGERLGPAWSPDGTRLVYYVQTRAMYTAVPEDIMILQVDKPGAEHVMVTRTSLIVDRDPAWSPEGQTIAFCSDFKLMVINVDGTNPRVLRDDYKYYTPAWSPLPADGSSPRLVVAGQLSDTDYGIFVVNVGDPLQGADGGNPIRIAQSNDRLLDPAWSPDGSTILFANYGDRQIYAVPAPPPEGFKELPKATKLTTVGVNEEPAWSPDGTTIAYVHTKGQNRDIWVMYKDGAGARPVTRAEGEDVAPAWRPR